MTEPLGEPDERWTMRDEIARAVYGALAGAGDAKPRGLLAATEPPGQHGCDHVSGWCTHPGRGVVQSGCFECDLILPFNTCGMTQAEIAAASARLAAGAPLVDVEEPNRGIVRRVAHREEG